MAAWEDILTYFNLDPVGLWLRSLILAIVATLVLKTVFALVSKQLRRVTKRTKLKWDDIAVDFLDGLKSFVVFSWCFYAIVKPLDISNGVEKPLLVLVVANTVYQIGIWGMYALRLWHGEVLARRIKSDPSGTSALQLMYFTFQAVFLVMLVLIGLANVGVDIGALVAGLGVGGIAIALAAQNVLGDLLASLSIVLDKPFVVGDFIVVGNDNGTVEQIGIKTTRVRSLSGEELVFANKDLLESRVRNYKRMWQRRIVFTFSVAYDTPTEKLEAIPGWVKSFVDEEPKLRFDRSHLFKFGEARLDFESVFFVSDPDYNIYMDLQQALFFKLIRKLRGEDVQFSLPKQSLELDFPLDSDMLKGFNRRGPELSV